MAFRMIRVEKTAAGKGLAFSGASIFAGTFVILGLGLFFLLLGNAVGLSVNNVVNPTVGESLRFWSFIYSAVTLILSYYAGSVVGTRSAEIEHTGIGALHGVISWGFASFLGAVLLALVAPGGNRIFLGTGPSLGNWLALCIVGFGLIVSAIGGMSGKKIIRYQRVHEEEGEVVKKVA